jgi:cytochrome b561
MYNFDRTFLQTGILHFVFYKFEVMKTNHQAQPQDEKESIGRYSAVAMVLHWLLGLSILAIFAVGFYMSDLPISPLKLKLYNYHKWAGISFLVLSVLRLLWRLTNRPPALPKKIEQTMPGWQSKAYHATHFALYALFFAVPLIGWAYSSAAGFPIVLFGAIPLPDFMAVDKEFAKQIKELHEISAFALLGLALLHIAAALKHHYFDKDGLLNRMLPART